jgi:phosphoglycerate dehydrogenase-like enzyme
VTWPEPPAPESKLFVLPNVFLTPHIAGSQRLEFLQQVDAAIDEFERYLDGEQLQSPVTLAMLETMA